MIKTWKMMKNDDSELKNGRKLSLKLETTLKMMITIWKVMIKHWKMVKNDDSKLKNGETWWLTLEKWRKVMINTWNMVKNDD